MNYKEETRIKEIDKRVAELNSLITFIFPIWNMIDRKLTSMKIEANALKDERQKLRDGQLMFTEIDF